jgi:hypothetical protein
MTMAHGEFSGEPTAVWLTELADDRKMQLVDSFWFLDPDARRWSADARQTVDGASIPRALWTLVGSPYTGDYRRASIVHDVACDEAGDDAAKRRAADRMFFHACRAGGCSTRRAIVLYIGVRIGAALPDVPAWRLADSFDMNRPELRRSAAALQLERDFEAIADRVLRAGESDEPADIERRTDDAIFEVTGWRAPNGSQHV